MVTEVSHDFPIVGMFFIVCLGKEVAKFTKLKYADTLVALDSFKNGQIELALRESFHKIDELLEDGVRSCSLLTIAFLCC